MNTNGNRQGKPGEGGRRRFPRHGQQKSGGQKDPNQQQPKQGRGNRDKAMGGLSREDFKRPAVSKDCAICGKPIFDLAGALADRDSSEPVHFDCALERVAAAETLQPNEKIVYLGAGCFAVVAFKNGKDGAFTVVRRIHWEKEGEKQPWRKDISSFITKI